MVKSKPVLAKTPMQSKNVNIDQCKNGFMISQYTDKGTEKYIAATKAEANKIASKLLGI